MNDEELYSRLSAILESVDEKEYPEMIEALRFQVGSDGEVYDDAFSIACELHGADGAKPLPELVAVFMEDVYLAEIEHGNFAAANDLGSLYYTGRIGKQSYEKALHYYSIAADGGDRQAQENLGYCYYYGRNCEVDYKKAFHYFALGAFDGI